MVAQLLVARLAEVEIDSFVDNDDSPFDGLTAAEQMVIVRVLPANAERARVVVAEFQAEKGSSES